MGVIYERNNALVDNPQPTQGAHLTEAGSDWLYAVTAIFMFCFVCSPYQLSLTLPFTLRLDSQANQDPPLASLLCPQLQA